MTCFSKDGDAFKIFGGCIGSSSLCSCLFDAEETDNNLPFILPSPFTFTLVCNVSLGLGLGFTFNLLLSLDLIIPFAFVFEFAFVKAQAARFSSLSRFLSNIFSENAMFPLILCFSPLVAAVTCVALTFAVFVFVFVLVLVLVFVLLCIVTELAVFNFGNSFAFAFAFTFAFGLSGFMVLLLTFGLLFALRRGLKFREATLCVGCTDCALRCALRVSSSDAEGTVGRNW